MMLCRNQVEDFLSEKIKEVQVLKSSSKMVKGKKGLKRSSKTKFEEFLEMDMPNASTSAQEDLELERKLAKKLKVKDGKLRGAEDGLSLLFEGIPSVLHSLKEEGPHAKELPNERNVHTSSNKKNKKRKTVHKFVRDDIADDSNIVNSELEDSHDVEGLEIPAKAASIKRSRKKKSQGQEVDSACDRALGGSQPVESHVVELAQEEPSSKATAMEARVKYVPPHLRSYERTESEELTQIRRRIRGLLNRMSESNLESITGEIAMIIRTVSRSAGSQIMSEEVLASCYNGPRGNEQHAAVFSAFVAGMACLVGMDFSAKVMASLAKAFEGEYLKEDNLSLRNLTLLLSYLCIFGVCSSDLIYDFLIMLSKRLTEVDVSTILTILQCCGMKIRGDDPAAMKDFIVSVQNRVNELKASSGDGQTKINGKRMEFMLETICDIKNNKKKPKEDSVQHTRIKKWLQKLRVEDILIRGLKWNKLLDPDKKGQWWLSGDSTARTDNVQEFASRMDKEVLEAQQMLQLAAAQRMNTDARKAVFCIIMSGEDYMDAFEKLLGLDLPGKQDREIMRVLLECCLQEKVFNKYYTVLASKLCEHDKNHKFTLQFCLWDHFKELESMPLQRSMHVAKFTAEMVASVTLSLAVLKTVDFSDPMQLTPRRIMHFRILFETIFEYPEKLIWNMFTRIAAIPELEALRNGITFFVKEYVVKANKNVVNKFKIAKKALNNIKGVLM